MRQSFGKEDIRVGAALHNMAGLYLSIDLPDYEKAETILREALHVSFRSSFNQRHDPSNGFTATTWFMNSLKCCTAVLNSPLDVTPVFAANI